MSEPVVEQAGNVVAERYPSLVIMANRLAEQAEANAGIDNQAIQMSIVGRMLEAEDEEALFALQNAGTVAAQDHLNTPFRLKKDGITVKKSTLADSSLPWYVLLDVTDLASGDAFTINTGAPSVIGILDKLVQWDDMGRGSFSDWDGQGGRAFQFIGKGMSGGNTLIHLMPLEKKSPKKPDAAAGKK